MANLIFGTATFKKKYGITNTDKILGQEEISNILFSAQSLGICEFDTAPGYGNAEHYLGEFLSKKIKARISSKIGGESCTSASSILNSVKESLVRTKTKKLRTVFLHEPELLYGPKAAEIKDGLKELLALDLTERIGASVYCLDTLLRVKEIFPELNTFQVPENICDQRMFNSKQLFDLKEENNSFIVRSVFLQGLLLMPLNDLPKNLTKARKSLLQLEEFSKSLGVTRLDLCLAYGKAIPWASEIIVGAAYPSQLREIVESNFNLPEDWQIKVHKLPNEILDPRKWAL
jgi:aryl-alcohol dehydrogenase-like predicted oxidoreductase